MPDLRTLSRLRDETKRLDRELENVRRLRDDYAGWLAWRGFPIRAVAAAAGLAPSFVDWLAQRVERSRGERAVQR